MTEKLNPRDWEAISAYIDNELTPKDRANFETRLKSEPKLQQLLEDMNRTRTLVRSLEPVRAPRNFTITPEMAGVRSTRFWPAPAFQWASAFATILFVLVIAGDFLGVLGPRQMPLVSSLRLESAETLALPELTLTLPASVEAEQALGQEAESLSETEGAVRIPAEEGNLSKAGQTANDLSEGEEELGLAPESEEPAGDAMPDEESPPNEVGAESSESSRLATLGIRILEVGLATIALLLALAAIIFRRRIT